MDCSPEESKKLEDSWCLIKSTQEYEASGNCPETNNNNITIICSKSTEEMEDSDGISVISESEMYKNNLNNSDGEAEKPNSLDDTDEDKSEEVSEESPVTTITKDECDEGEDSQADDEELNSDVTALRKVEEKTLKEYDSQVSNLQQPQQQPQSSKNSHGVMLLIGMSLIIAVLYTNVTSLRNELAKTSSIYEQRIARLEQENDLLRSQLDELLWKLKNVEGLQEQQQVPLENKRETFDTSDNIIQKDRATPDDDYLVKRQEPVTKKVWLGGEIEEQVKILDKKYNSIPDYCYHTDENDLFYEYNKENCERKKQKMEERLKKLQHDNMKKNVDSVWSSKSNEDYDKFIERKADEILQSLNEEIREIKKNRLPSTADGERQKEERYHESLDNNQPKRKQSAGTDSKYSSYSDKEEDGKRAGKNGKKKKRQPKNRGGNDSTNEWNEKRSSGREQARNKHEMSSDENWYLKRQNDREIHRLAAGAIRD